jgi:hypothetical protein
MFSVVQDNNMTPHFPEDELGKKILSYNQLNMVLMTF